MRLRLFVLIIIPLVVLAASAAVVRYKFAEATARQLYDDTLSVVALTISRDVVLSEGDMLADALLESLTAALGDPIYYRVSGPGGRFLTGYSDAPLPFQDDELESGRPVFLDSVYHGQPVRVVLLREFIAEPEIGGWTTVQVWQHVTQRERLSLQLLYQAAGLMAMVIAAAAGLVWFGIRLGLAPLTSLREAIALRSPSDLRPIARPVPREVRPIVAAMNTLFERLADAFRQRDNFISNAAHQLRNPIAAIQAQAEAAETAPSETELRRRTAEIAEAARRTSRLTQQMLAMERLQADLSPSADRVDVALVGRDVLRALAPAALRRGVDVSLEVASGPHSVVGNTVMLAEAIENLVDNALRYGCRAGGAVIVEIKGGEGRVRIIVADDGPGVPTACRETIFERFQRGGEEGGRGSGLGLAIVREIATHHGGDVHLTPSERGARFEIDLPAARTT